MPRKKPERLTRLAALPALESLPDSTLLTAQDVAAYLAMNPATLSNQRALGRGIPFVKLNRQVRYIAGDVKRFLMTVLS